MHHDIIITKAAYETEEWGEENLLNYLPFGSLPVAVTLLTISPLSTSFCSTTYVAAAVAVSPGSSAVNELMTGVPQLRVYGNTVSATGMNAGSQVSVYDMNGRQVATARADAQGQAQIDLSSMGRGIYIVTDGETAHKFVK